MNKEYYIATAAEKVFLPPAGDIYINGFAAEAMFYKGSLDKLGIEAGSHPNRPKYKNAPDQYTRKEMGEAHSAKLSTRFSTNITIALTTASPNRAKNRPKMSKR